ncbi:uncharacterized protein BDV17DRAFT_271577 [Aspergillus undulatus]|uniref:uncharacterized protein n=1 Tax=Aspergillus undulatus TaxID=1810928 RepID=UPI003CCC9EB4
MAPSIEILPPNPAALSHSDKDIAANANTNFNSNANTAPPPTHPDRIQVNRSAEAFSNSATSLISLPAGALFAKMTSATPAPKRTYTSVATGEQTQIELNSDLVFCNHSCAPSLVFDMARMEVRVAEDRPLRKGDALTFFYPSSEWTMVQPFACTCGEDGCLGVIAGASDLSRDVLEKYWLNEHVVQLMEQRK